MEERVERESGGEGWSGGHGVGECSGEGGVGGWRQVREG